MDRYEDRSYPAGRAEENASQYHHPSPFRDSPSPSRNYPSHPLNHAASPAPPLHRDRSNASYNPYPEQSHQAYQAPSYFPEQQNPFSDAREDHRYMAHSTSVRTASTATPGMDNLGAAAAGGGITGIAIGVANANERDSGVQAMRGLPQSLQSGHGTPLGRGRDPIGTDTPDVPEPPHLHQTYQHENPFASSQCPAIPGDMTPRTTPSQSSLRLNDHHQDFYLADQPTYTDNPYQRHSALWDRRIPGGEIHPDEIEDDADDIMPIPNPRRRSILSFGQKSDHSLPAGMAAGSKGVLTPSGGYGVVNAAEKAAWLQEHSTKKRKLRWLFGAVIILALLGIVAGAVIAGLRLTQKNSSASSSQGQSAAQDTSANGVLDINSAEIQSLMGNSNLHRVFPGMDYTPFNAQYPACLTNPPSQNNVTRDLAVLSQLTNTIRLYGTDCNQTDMVLDAIDRLELTDMKVWLAVWLDNNQTTNDRGLAAMYDILNRKGTGPFAGVILGNEVLFRKDMDIGTLETLITNVRSNLTAKSINLQIAVADLGDNWTAALAAVVDVVMSNIHPFFAGVTSQEAAGWTWDFWQNNDVTLTTGTSKKNIISEVGWPSGGGNDCGAGTCTSSTEGSVAGIAEMNTFMDSFVCQSLANGTDYFWFEAFDEPWKVIFNTPTESWEDKWGLMDPGRNLKAGLTIPACGGKTI